MDSDQDMSLEFEDGPLGLRRSVSSVHFDDCRVPRDHPKIASGEVEITNDYTP
jgi:hypothetical protein